jgi:glucose-6-phosphate 1-dehydrogenase
MTVLWILLAILYVACWVHFRHTASADSKRFTRYAGVEQCWSAIAPLRENSPSLHPYTKGSWGPDAAEKLISGHRRRRQPWVVR